MAEKISILGCGWLGLPLAKVLHQKGYHVMGSTTKPEKLATIENAGIEAFLLEANPDIKQEVPDRFFGVDCLVLNIPPKVTLKGPEFHLEQLRHIIKRIPQDIGKVIFVSSTSVYPDLNRVVFEEDAHENANPVLYKAEAIIKGYFARAIVIRMAGLMGPDRYPAKYFAGKTGLSFGSVPVNYIHQTDAVSVLAAVVEAGFNQGTFNAVAPQHPTRQEVYLKNCKDLQLPAPVFVDAGPQEYKMVNGDALMAALNYSYIYPDPMAFRYEIL
jgi:nucleoside-diphosphate-sugar epimerase